MDKQWQIIILYKASHFVKAVLLIKDDVLDMASVYMKASFQIQRPLSHSKKLHGRV